MLELLKELLDISFIDYSKDNVLQFYISKSQNAIKNYCGFDVVPDSLFDVIVDLAMYYYQNKDNTGIIQQTQGNRSATYVNGIPKSIKDLLPLPRIRVVG